MSGKRYPEEFKIEAVKQVVDRGYSVASVATRLDITTHSLYAWIKNTVRILPLIKNSQMLRPRSAVSRKS
jgi:transposase-like protein